MNTAKPIFDDQLFFAHRTGAGSCPADGLMLEVIHALNQLVRLERCSCMDASNAPISLNCAVLHDANVFLGAVNRLRYAKTEPLIRELPPPPQFGAELADYISLLAEIARRVSSGLHSYGLEICHWPIVSDDTSMRATSKRQRVRPLVVPDRNRSLYKMIFAMAVDKYSYESESGYQGATAQISTATVIAGCYLSEETIRTILREARDYVASLPDD